MAFNIAVKSKYNPFKYEDYVKPLDEYAKSYEKYEDLITAEEVKLSALEPYTDLFSQNNDDQQKLKEYNQYVEDLKSLSNQLATQGYTRDIKGTLRGLLPKYGNTIKPLYDAMQKKAHAIEEYTNKMKSNKATLSSLITPQDVSLMAYWGAGAGSSEAFTIDGNAVESYAASAAATHTKNMKQKSIARQQGNKTITNTEIGVEIPSFRVNNGVITFTSGDEASQDWVRSVYANVQDKYQYNQLDDASKKRFDDFFTHGLTSGWVHQKSETQSSAQPHQIESATVVLYNPHTNKDEQFTKATMSDGSTKYTNTNGVVYSGKEVEKWVEKQQKEVAENEAIKRAQDNAYTTYTNDFGSKILREKANGSDPDPAFMLSSNYLFENNMDRNNPKTGTYLSDIINELNYQGGNNPLNVISFTFDRILQNLKNISMNDTIGLEDIGMASKDDDFAFVSDYQKQLLLSSDYYKKSKASLASKRELPLLIRYDGSGGDYHIAGFAIEDVMQTLNNKLFNTEARLRISPEDYCKLIYLIHRQTGYSYEELKSEATTYINNKYHGENTPVKNFLLKQLDDIFTLVSSKQLPSTQNNSFHPVSQQDINKTLGL